jgi:hypothetical protein
LRRFYPYAMMVIPAKDIEFAVHPSFGDEVLAHVVGFRHPLYLIYGSDTGYDELRQKLPQYGLQVFLCIGGGNLHYGEKYVPVDFAVEDRGNVMADIYLPRPDGHRYVGVPGSVLRTLKLDGKNWLNLVKTSPSWHRG